MTTLLRDPLFSDLAAMEQRMNSLFNRVFGSVVGGDGIEARRWTPLVDVVETDDQFVVLVDLPGIDPDTVSVEYQDDVLTISGERGQAVAGELRRWERPTGEFSRSLALPKGIDAGAIQADFRDGVLELRLPKPEGRKRMKIELAGSGAKQLNR